MQPSPVDPSDDDLDAEIEYLRALVNDEPGDADALADLAAALLERATRAHGADDVPGLRVAAEEAIGWARAGLAVAAPADAELAGDLRAMLGLALQRRFVAWLWLADEDDEDPAGLEAARSDWTEAVTLVGGSLDAMSRADPDDPDLPTEIEAFSGFLAFGVVLDPPKPEDRDAFVTWAQWLFDRVPPVSAQPMPICDEWDLRTRLAQELYERADSGAGDRESGLRAGIAHLEAALPLTPEGDAGKLAAVLVPLTLGCAELLGGDATQYALLDRLVAHARRAWEVLPADDDDRPVVGLYLASGLHEQLIRPQAPPYSPEAVNLVITVMSEVEPRVAGDPDIHLLAEAVLGNYLVSRGQYTGSMDDLAAAERFVVHAASELPADDPQYDEVTSHLATAMTGLAHTGLLAAHYGSAIDLLRAAAGRIADPERGAQFRAFLGLTLIARTYDQRGADIGAGLEYLKAAHKMAPPGSPTRIWVALNLGSLLAGQFFVTGDRQQLKAARFYLDLCERVYRGLSPGTGPVPGLRAGSIPHLDALLAANSGLISIARAIDGDAAAAAEGINAFRTALEQLPPGHPHAVKVHSDLALAHLLHASREDSAQRSAAEIRLAISELDRTVQALPAGHLMRAATQLRAGGGLVALGLRTGNLATLREGIAYLTRLHGELSPRTDVRLRCVGVLGFISAELYGLTSLPADRTAALAWLEQAAAEYEQQPGHPQHATLLARLARFHQANDDGPVAVQAGLAALRVRVRDVLLQTGTAHGLASARIAADDAAEIAGWCLDEKDPGRAVEAQELGRGLVLHAATAVTTLPDLLAAEGHGDLAQEWRDQVGTDGPEMPWEGDGDPGYVTSLLGGASLAAPSDLRKRTLAALAGSALGDLLAPPGSAQVADAVRLTGADALVYLLPPGGGRPGRALVVPADGRRPHEVPLPLLTDPPMELVEYRVAQAEWFAGSAASPARWLSALGALSDWSWPAVIEPVLRALPGDLPRLVLVPSGQLSQVPWHAARYRLQPADGWRYAIADAVFSYAASGRQLVEVSRRPPLPLPASPVIAAPASSLDPGKLEARALADRVYPGARYLGPGAAAAGRGTPGEVLAALPSATEAGASLLHLACHAFADDAPGRSRFELAGHEVLTVETILRRASGRPSGAAGGLVDLVACDSDLAAAHYDEALTLATAFLAAGACTVVGARWAIRVEQSSLLAFMFHYFLVRDDLAPRDALRQAQLWMLDPHRPVPDEIPPELAGKARTRTLAQPAFWAAITHQGW
jgi:CHAT domain